MSINDNHTTTLKKKMFSSKMMMTKKINKHFINVAEKQTNKQIS